MSWKTYHDRVASSGRRRFLRGVGMTAGGLFLAPFLRQLEAEASGITRKKLVIVVEGNGYYGFNNWTGLTQNSPTIASLGNLQSDLPQAGALEPYRAKVVALNGLANKQGAGLGAGHRSHWYPLTCLPYYGGSAPGGPSVDSMIGDALGADCVFPVVRIGAGGAGSTIGLVPTVSASGRGSSVAAQHDPQEAWRELFGVVSDDPDDRAAFEEKTLMLDYLHEDVQRLLSELNGEERWKLERYLYSIETFQVRQERLAEAADELQACAPGIPPMLPADSLDVGTVFEQMANLAGAALMCGLTDVVVLDVGAGPLTLSSHFNAWGFGGRHSMGHGGGETAERPGGPAGLIQTSNEIAQRVVDGIIEPLSATPVGDGSMFDNTAVVFLNDNGSEHHSKYDNFPVVVCGDLGGALNTGGRLIEYPNHQQAGTRGLAEFWKTVMEAMDVPHDGFADGGSAPNAEPLGQLLT